MSDLTAAIKVRLDEELRAALEREALAARRTVSSLVRVIVSDYFAAKRGARKVEDDA